MKSPRGARPLALIPHGEEPRSGVSNHAGPRASTSKLTGLDPSRRRFAPPQDEGLGVRRASSPLFFVRPETSRSFLSPYPPKGRAERRAFHRARGARCTDTQSAHPAPCAYSTGQPSLDKSNGGATFNFPLSKAARPGSRYCACVPHADGLCSLLHVPGRAAFAPLSRSCELSPGHALGPSARVAGRLRLPSRGCGYSRPSTAFAQARHRSGHRHPLHDMKRS